MNLTKKHQKIFPKEYFLIIFANDSLIIKNQILWQQELNKVKMKKK